MELKNSSIKETWKLCSLIGFLCLFLFTNNPQTNFRATIVAFTTTLSSLPPPSPPTSKINETITQDDKCNMYEGRWVYKPEENPMYHVNDCPFIEEKMRCRINGRSDFAYEGWTWESNGCNIPLFDGKDMLERLRGKRMIIVGDSLNRNQWESLTCLLYTSLSDPQQALVDAGGWTYKIFHAKEYNMTLEFYWAPFLVHHDETHKSGKRVLWLDKLDPSSEKWVGADVMLFNSGHWWTHLGKLRSWDMFEIGGKLVDADAIEKEAAYGRAVSRLSDWVADNVDPTKTKVFFRSISPEHMGKNWCFNVSRPIPDESYVPIYPRSMIEVAETKIKEMNIVRYLNITKLSSYRRDAHPSVYRFKDGNMQLEMALADCSHWCLPGLPDTWNRIFYASLFYHHLAQSHSSLQP